MHVSQSPMSHPAWERSRPAPAAARADLEAFAGAGPDDFYAAASHLRGLLPLYVPAARLATLQEDLAWLGRAAAGEMDGLARENDREENLPQLDRYDAFGRRTEGIRHHPSYHGIGRIIYRSGMLAALEPPDDMVGALARHYLSSHCGEAGHNCPVACSAGVIRALQRLGTDEQRARYLPRLLTRDYDAHLEGAQFLTEIQGGSDVGANATQAVRQDDGSYRLYGEKWFATNIDADLFLMTARFADGAGGTRGLGLFLVPRRLPDGRLNDFAVRRLKDKVGTRSLASTEADFLGATAFHLGPEAAGFNHMMELVINTSRLYIGTGCVGPATRAFLTAHGYAQHRRAFGQTIGDYPLIQETLADMRADLDAMLSLCLHLGWVQDRIARGEVGDDERGFFRMALNLNKMYTARRAREIIFAAIEVLGGNGAIEGFSVLPRLLRDLVVIENWEGTYNTLINQIARDMRRFGVHRGFFRTLRERAAETGSADLLTAAADDLEAELRAAQALDSPATLLVLRPWMTRATAFCAATVRAWERERTPGSEQTDDASFLHFVQRRVHRGLLARDEGYLDRLRLLAGRG